MISENIFNAINKFIADGIKSESAEAYGVYTHILKGTYWDTALPAVPGGLGICKRNCHPCEWRIQRL